MSEQLMLRKEQHDWEKLYVKYSLTDNHDKLDEFREYLKEYIPEERMDETSIEGI